MKKLLTVLFVMMMTSTAGYASHGGSEAGCIAGDQSGRFNGQEVIINASDEAPVVETETGIEV